MLNCAGTSQRCAAQISLYRSTTTARRRRQVRGVAAAPAASSGSITVQIQSLYCSSNRPYRTGAAIAPSAANSAWTAGIRPAERSATAPAARPGAGCTRATSHGTCAAQRIAVRRRPNSRRRAACAARADGLPAARSRSAAVRFRHCRPKGARMRRTIPSTQLSSPRRCDGDEHAERDLGGDVIGASRRNPDDAHVLHLPRPARRRERGKAPAHDVVASVGLDPRAPEVARSIVFAKLRLLLNSVDTHRLSSERNPEMLLNPTIASTAPLAGIRSPRRASGLNSGSSLEQSSRRDRVARAAGPFSRARLALQRLFELGAVLQQQRMQRPRVDEEHTAFERAQPSGASSRRCSRGRHRTSRRRWAPA